ncbi:hypothetical protein CBL_11546 [Carabus blaptoides fortunei]
MLVVTPYFVIDRTDLEYYARNVTQNYIFEIERLGSCQLPIPDFTQEINKSYFGYDVFGYVNFTNGRIGYLGDIYHYQPSHRYDNNATMASVSWGLALKNKRIYFDYYAKLSVDTFQGIVAFNITNNMDVDLKVIKDFTSGALYSTISYRSIIIQKQKLSMNVVPKNNYLQIIAAENDYDPMRDILLLQKEVFSNLFQKAVSKISFPEIRFKR